VSPPGGRRLPDATRLRLWTGLVLFAFAAGHLANHALGLVSLDAMEAGRRAFFAFWHAPPAQAALYASLLLHAVLGLRQLWRRRSLRMPPGELVQLATGLLIPLWLTVHLLGTAGLSRLADVRTSYAFELDLIWPGGMRLMTTLLALVWLHGCLGVHRWLRLRPWYARLRAPALALALLLPTLALLGVVAGGREYAAREAADPAWAAALAREQRWPSDEVRQQVVYGPERAIVAGFQWLVVLLLAARAARWAIERRRNVRLAYPGGRVVTVPRGMTVLEASRARGVPHAAVCGGRGRCSTCRVRVGKGADALPPPSPEEARVLARIGAPADVRLACQIRPAADLVVTPLMPADAGPGSVLSGMDPRGGVERELAVLFADLRAFTRFSEGRLPYDTVFVLNRYFEAMGEAIERSGGRVDKFIGDGIMALFGLEAGPDAAARSALLAARSMALALDALNRDLAAELDEPLRMGIGLHLGPVIVGELGYGRAVSLTAIGDTVNVASRLESLTKELAAQLLVSEALARRAGGGGGGLEAFPAREVDVRGRAGRIAVRVVADARALPGGAAGAGEARRWWRRASLRWALSPWPYSRAWSRSRRSPPAGSPG
jgi:adenylate cyclase